MFTFHVLQDTELVQPGLNWHAQPAWGKLPPVVTHSCLLATVTVTAGRKGRLGSHRLFKESSMTKINPCLLCTLPSHLFPSKVELCKLLLLLHAGGAE